MNIPKNNNLLDRARSLRREMTPQERKLWYLFLRSYPIKFYKQRIIGPYIVDFYCASAKLIIEIDGSQHYTVEGKAYDAERSQVFEKYDILVLRYLNSDIDNKYSGVCEMIDKTVKERMNLTSQWDMSMLEE